MLKRLTVLAMAVGVLAAFALPASASASWKQHAQPIPNDVDLRLTGEAAFHGPLGGVKCQVTSTVTFFTGQTTGEVDSFVPEPTSATVNCAGTGGLSFCTIHNVNPIGLPWLIHTAQVETVNQTFNPPTQGSGVKHEGIDITSGNIESQTTGGFCPINKILLTGATVSAVPNQPNTITTVSLNGQLQAHLQTLNGTQDTQHVNVTGTLQFEDTATEGHKYSI